jgi:hypothetical protein
MATRETTGIAAEKSQKGRPEVPSENWGASHVVVMPIQRAATATADARVRMEFRAAPVRTPRATSQALPLRKKQRKQMDMRASSRARVRC